MYIPTSGLLHLLAPSELRELQKAIEEEFANRLVNSNLEPSTSETILWKKGNKIDAIREMRTRTGAGLKEAKDAFEIWAAFNKLG